MSRRIETMLGLVLIAATLCGCSVSLQSSQYSFFKGLFEKNEPPPPKNWRVTWNAIQHQVYAINLDDGTFFANEEGLLVKFAGWQVVELVLPSIGFRKVAAVTAKKRPDNDVGLTYSDGKGRFLATHRCSVWQEEAVVSPKVGTERKSAQTTLTQQCSSLEGGYTNTITLNQQRQWTALRFTVVPNESPIVVQYIEE